VQFAVNSSASSFIAAEGFCMRSVIHAANRIVVKVGSSLVTNDGKGLDGAGALGR
jgi:hypothetical protein